MLCWLCRENCDDASFPGFMFESKKSRLFKEFENRDFIRRQQMVKSSGIGTRLTRTSPRPLNYRDAQVRDGTISSGSAGGPLRAIHPTKVLSKIPRFSPIMVDRDWIAVWSCAMGWRPTGGAYAGMDGHFILEVRGLPVAKIEELQELQNL